MATQHTIPATTADKNKEIDKLSSLEKFVLNAYLIFDAPSSEKLIIAYEISRPKESQANRQSIYMQARKWINSDKCRYYIEQRKEQLFKLDQTKRLASSDGEGNENNPDNVNRSKDDILTELNII
ncbi:hypothetical protein [Dysgonomonas alginatilytica]|nr:hypothetical protein [Dysgonomonas alginatilytica]